MYSEVNSLGLPVDLFGSTLGRTITAINYERYKNALVIDRNDNGKISVVGLENTSTNAIDLLDFWQKLDNWAQYYPENITPVVKRLSDLLLSLRRATPTDGPYDFYELLLFWNTALRPEYFTPVEFTESVYSSMILNALEYDYQILYTRVQNLINRGEDPNKPLVTVTESFPDYVIPDLPPLNDAPTNGNENGRIWQIWLVIFIILILILK